MGKGEIACYEQFLLLPQCFPETGTADFIKTRACLEKGLDNVTVGNTFY